MPDCFMGMALPALLSLEFSPFSPMYNQESSIGWAQAVVMADGIRNAPESYFGPAAAQTLWILTLIVGFMVLAPSQMSILEDICRRWTDIFWSGSQRVRETMKGGDVKRIYYTIMIVYVFWTFICATLFLFFSKPKVMVLVIANLNNVGLGFTAFFLLWVNLRFLPKPLRPGWLNRIGMLACGLFYLGLAGLVFYQKQLPIFYELMGWTTP